MPKRYTRGRHAVGECARSGRKMMLKDMVADGYYPNLKVDPAWYEGKHPQESLPEIEDPVSLWRPAPERDQIGRIVRFPIIGFDGEDLNDLRVGFAISAPNLQVLPLLIPTVWFEDDFSSYANGELLGE